MTPGLDFLAGGGEMGRLIAAMDWRDHVLGEPAAWPVALKIAVGMMLNSRFPKCIVWGGARTTIYNDAYRPILGDKPEAMGRPFDEVWSEAWTDIGPLVARAMAGEATFIEDFPMVTDRYGYPEQTYFTFCYSPIRDEDGRIGGMMDTVIETTGKMEAEREARLLNSELAHRINNMLGVVSAIASQTLRGAASVEEARTTLTQRFMALGRANSALTKSTRSDAPLRQVVEGALEPHSGARARISVLGMPMNLPAKQAQAMALAVHELATNAIKYGALSADNGEVDICWMGGAPDSDEPFVFSWVERGGPAVQPPTRRGFGSRLIEQALAQEFRGEARIEYRPTGLHFELRTTMRSLGAQPPAAS